MDIKEITLRRIQAIRDAEAAAKEEKKCHADAQRLREIEFFSPLRDIWESVKDLPSATYARGETKIIPMWQHAWRTNSDNAGYSSLSLKGWDGNSQFTLRAKTGCDRHCYIEKCRRDYNDPTQISMPDAEDMLLKHIARYLITDDEQPE